MDDLRWMSKGMCAGTGTDTHFPQERLRSEADRLDTREAKRQCGICTQQEKCLAYALEKRIDYGIWGGLTVRERHRLLRPPRPRPGLLSAAS